MKVDLTSWPMWKNAFDAGLVTETRPRYSWHLFRESDELVGTKRICVRGQQLFFAKIEEVVPSIVAYDRVFKIEVLDKLNITDDNNNDGSIQYISEGKIGPEAQLEDFQKYKSKIITYYRTYDSYHHLLQTWLNVTYQESLLAYGHIEIEI